MIRHPHVKLYHLKPQTLKHVGIWKILRWTHMWYNMGKALTWRFQILNIAMIRHPYVNLYHLKPQNLKHVGILKILRWTHICYNIGKLLTWKWHILNFIMIWHPQVKLHHPKHQAKLYAFIVLVCESESSIQSGASQKRRSSSELSKKISDRSET